MDLKIEEGPLAARALGALDGDPVSLETVVRRSGMALADVAEALRPLLEQTQEHVRDLQTVLGR